MIDYVPTNVGGDFLYTLLFIFRLIYAFVKEGGRMIKLMKTITIQTDKKKQIIDITEKIEQLLNYSSGLCHIFIKHTTAAVTTSDLDPGTDLDMLDAFEAMMPKLHYRHEHNPAHVTDHILSSIIGSSLIVPFDAGKLLLGTWQRVVLVELDGPRVREATVSFIVQNELPT